MKRVILTKNGHCPPPPPSPPPTASTAAALFGAPPGFLVIIALSLRSAKEMVAPHTLRHGDIAALMCEVAAKETTAPHTSRRGVIAALMCEVPPKRQRHLTHHAMVLWLR